jgi:hypothetical protein
MWPGRKVGANICSIQARKHSSVHWSVEKHWRDEAGQRQAADKSDGLPMTVWIAAPHRSPLRAQPRRRAMFVERPLSSN